MARRTASQGPDFGLLASKLRDSAVKQFGSSAVQGLDDFLNAIYGVHLYHNLPLQYLLGVDVLPCGRLISVVGKPGVGKSTFGWYLASLFSRYSGIVNLLETENKPNPDMAMAIIDNYVKRPSSDSWFTWQRAKTLDIMLKQMMHMATFLRDEVDAKAANIPVMMLVDSLSAITSDKAMKEILDGDGSPGFAAAKNCALFKENLQAYSPTVADLPILTVCINHQKPKFTGGEPGKAAGPSRPSYMPPEMTEAGGIHKDFNFSWILQLEKGASSYSVTDGAMTTFRFKVKKEAFREARSKPVEVPLRSKRTIREVDGKRVITDRVFFDWDTALTWLLTEDEIIPKSVLNTCFDLKKDTKGYSSKRLGLSCVTPREMGKAIHADEKLVKDLQDYVFKIHRKPHFGVLRPDCDVDDGEVVGGVQIESDVLSGESEEEGDGEQAAQAVQTGVPGV